MKLLYVCVLGLCAQLSLCTAQTASTTAPEDYGFIRKDPPECTAGAGDCKYFVGIQRNPEDEAYLDFHLEGLPDWGGWVAIGFSKTRDMVSHVYKILVVLFTRDSTYKRGC